MKQYPQWVKVLIYIYDEILLILEDFVHAFPGQNIPLEDARGIWFIAATKMRGEGDRLVGAQRNSTREPEVNPLRNNLEAISLCKHKHWLQF